MALSQKEITSARSDGTTGSSGRRGCVWIAKQAASRMQNAQGSGGQASRCHHQLPDNLPKDDSAIDQHVQRIIAIAQCLATECSAPELWNKLSGVTDDNPFVQWNHWFNELPERMQRLEYEALCAEARAFIEKAKTLRGTAARQQEAMLFGRLGELLFQSGQVSDSIQSFQAAYQLCVESHDVEGQSAYLYNLWRRMATWMTVKPWLSRKSY